MKTLKFKTNINCGSCVATVKPYLDELHIKWHVDTDSKDKILTIESNSVDEVQVKKVVEQAGYKVDSLEGGLYKKIFG